MIVLLLLLSIQFSLSQDNHHRNRHPVVTNDIETRIDDDILSNMKLFCPVSSSFDTEFDSIHGYPIDIFDQKLYQNIMNSNNQLIKDEYFFNCSGYEKNSIIHQCSTLTTCPITKQNIIDAISRQKSWRTFHSFCSIRETLREPTAVINLIILGGSVTASSGCWGCCCVNTLDAKCFSYGKYAYSYSFREQASYCGSSMHEQYGDMAKECSWPTFFYKWFSHKSMSKINFINLGESGATSQYKAERVIDQLKKYGITELTENDIILIDHSVNDANSYNILNNGNKFTHDRWIIGIETLIRRLLYFSKAESWPSIIILEQFPFNSERTPQDSNYHSNMPSYSDAYSKVAQKYMIPIWSYKDVVWKMNEETFSTYLRFEQIPFDGIHPSWYVHLFYADLISAIFVLTFHECLIETVTNKNKLSSHIRPKNQQYYHLLPPPHLAINTSYCDKNPPYLDISADMITYKRTTEMIGTYKLNGSWIINEERIGKSGFISSFFNRSISEVSILTFSMHNYSLLFDGNKPSLIKIHYMRTYKNAGIVDVYLCNNLIGSLDTLWRDHEHFRYTFNDIFTFDYIAFHSDYCHGYVPPKIELIHRYYDSKNTDFGIVDDNNELEKLIRSENDARLDQKFKLVSISACKKEI